MIAARMTSETGWSSTVATVSSCSACSFESRIVIAFAGFMPVVCHVYFMLVKHRGGMVSWRHQATEATA